MKYIITLNVKFKVCPYLCANFDLMLDYLVAPSLIIQIKIYLDFTK